MALHYGYCDFAQYDGVGRAKASLSSGILRLSFPKYPANPNFVIPRAVAESIFACQCSSRRSQRPWHSTMDTATSRSMTVLVGQRRLCPLASFSCHSPSTRGTQTPSFPKYPANPNFVIPRAVAESIFACQRSSRRSQRPWHSTMDTATSRSMTVLVGQRRLCPLASFSCHSRSKRRTQTSSFRAKSRNPSLLVNVVAGEASGLGTPLWILRLRAV